MARPAATAHCRCRSPLHIAAAHCRRTLLPHAIYEPCVWLGPALLLCRTAAGMG